MDKKEAARFKLSRQKKKKDDEQNLTYIQRQKSKERKRLAQERKSRLAPPEPFYDRLMREDTAFESMVKNKLLERRARQTHQATFKNGKFLLDSKNIDDLAQEDEMKAHKVTQQRNEEEDLAELKLQESKLAKQLDVSMSNLDQMRTTKMSLQQALQEKMDDSPDKREEIYATLKLQEFIDKMTPELFRQQEREKALAFGR